MSEVNCNNTVPFVPIPDADTILLHQNKALYRAFKHNKAAYPRRSTYQQEQDTFFQTPARGDYGSTPRKITIGTDCSGMEAPMQALANMNVPHEHLFSCDFDPDVRTTINANFAPKTLFHDIMGRDNSKVPAVDVYNYCRLSLSTFQSGRQAARF